MNLPAYLPITSDYGFKATFGNPHNTQFLRRALPALIGSDVPIREVTLEPTAYAGTTPDSRSSIFDLSCVDEHGRYFIVEMQVARSPDFLQRLKFYASQKLNLLVQRGRFEWADLPQIYAVALLSQNLLPGSDCQTVANLRTASGELLDTQLTFVLVELDKFHLSAADVRTDLEKLLFTMNNVENPALDLENRPDFWEEDWLKSALDELSTRNVSPEQYEQMMLSMARRATVLQQERERERAQQQAIAEGQRADAEGQRADTAEQKAVALEVTLETTIRNLLKTGRLTVEEIAEISNTTPEQVRRLAQ